MPTPVQPTGDGEADQEPRLEVTKPLDFEVRCNVYAWAS